MTSSAWRQTPTPAPFPESAVRTLVLFLESVMPPSLEKAALPYEGPVALLSPVSAMQMLALFLESAMPPSLEKIVLPYAGPAALLSLESASGLTGL